MFVDKADKKEVLFEYKYRRNFSSASKSRRQNVLVQTTVKINIHLT